MINKYKDYLIKVYEKIKSSIVNKENVKIEKFGNIPKLPENFLPEKKYAKNR